MKERNRNIDVIRGIMMLLIVLYHAWVICDSVPITNKAASIFVSLGGEIGVTGFFMLSGFGIYYAISKTEDAGCFNFCNFMKKRFQRIMPQYYVAFFVVILFTDGAQYLSQIHILDLCSHLLFIHNLFPSYFGAINGVLWTMGVIMQFYVFSIFLYRGIKKWNSKFVIGSIIITVLCKMLVFKYVIPVIGEQYVLYGGRQLITALDNFVVGMFIANLLAKRKIEKKWIYGLVSIAAFIVLGIWGDIGLQNGIHVDNMVGYVWHSITTCILAVLFISFSYLPLSYENKFIKSILWIAKYEYGIYLWHLVMFNNLRAKAPIVQNLLDNNLHWIAIFIFIVLAIMVGWIFSVIIDGQRIIRKENA